MQKGLSELEDIFLLVRAYFNRFFNDLSIFSKSGSHLYFSFATFLLLSRMVSHLFLFSRSVMQELAKPILSSAIKISCSFLTAKPSAPTDVDTIGTPRYKPSSTFTFMPLPNRSGAI